MGGLSKKASQIKSFTQRENLPALFVDSGALLYKTNAFRTREHQQKVAEIKASGIARAMQAMGCRATGIAPQELAAGVSRLKEIQKTGSLNWVSMNLVDKATGKPVFAPFVTTKAGDTSIAIFGLTDGKLLPDDADYALLPWQDTLPDQLARVRKTADMVILMSSYSEPVNTKIAQSVKGIDIILQSGHSLARQTPRLINNTLLTRVSARGKYLGLLRIHWTKSGKWGQDFAAKIKKVQNKLDRVNWQIGRLQKKIPTSERAANGHYAKLLKAQKDAEQELAALQAEKESAKAEPCSYTSQFIALRSSMPDDPEVEAIVEETTKEVNALNQQRKRQSTALRSSMFAGLAGTEQCGECHQRQADFWKTTGHAKAWQTLAVDHQQFNDDCLICHVTLPFYQSRKVQQGGLLAGLPQKFQDVGCESCHGPAAAHVAAPEETQPALPDQNTCLQCHTDEHDENFIYANKLKMIKCPRG